ncbi:hypothetical protein BBJ28_00001241 [Nothophytophthora sp. Chile5]|nr:hypothetical protein BBJ28_00001241 [Nothophytophthora sp. Chile5]
MAVTLAFCLAASSVLAVDSSLSVSLDGVASGYGASLQTSSPLGDANTEHDDLITSLRIVYPLDGSVERPPVLFATEIVIHPGSEALLASRSQDLHLCLEINNVTRACYRLDGPAATYEHWELGNCTTRAFMTDSSTGKRYWQSALIAFAVVNDFEFDAHLARLIEEERPKHRSGYDLTLVEWAKQQQRQQDEVLLLQLQQDEIGIATVPTVGRQQKEDMSVADEDLVLVVGVKTAVVSNFALRQAMRETWASKEALPRGVKVLFLGCRPFSAVKPGDSDDDADATERKPKAERRRLWEAIELEKRVYGDMLTDELDCDDNYFGLADKVKEFLHLAATRFAHAQYVMIADDDLYVRLDMIVEKFRQQGPRRGFYSGQVLQMAPIRSVDNRNRLPEEQYSLSQLPPFALGEYVFLSMDCAQFVSKNRRRLRDLGGMDDISIPLWMLTIQVHPQAHPGLEHLRAGPCTDDLVALGDLSPLAIRAIHANVLAKRRFCHGFHRYTWLKPKKLAPPPGFAYSLPRFPEPLQVDILLGMDESGNREVVIVISTPSQAGIKASSLPSSESLPDYLCRVCAKLRLNFPGAVGTSSCAEIADRLRSELQMRYKQLEAAENAVVLQLLSVWRQDLFDHE